MQGRWQGDKAMQKRDRSKDGCRDERGTVKSEGLMQMTGELQMNAMIIAELERVG